MTCQAACPVAERSSVPQPRICIPMVIGKNRLRGNAVGAMVDDQAGEDHLGFLRHLLRQEAYAADVEPTKEWLANSITAVLAMYQDAHRDWLATKDADESLGHVFEASLPSGTALLLGDRRVLARFVTAGLVLPMQRDQAERIVAAVEAARERDEYSSVYTACKAARVAVSEYRDARMMVYGPNTSA